MKFSFQQNTLCIGFHYMLTIAFLAFTFFKYIEFLAPSQPTIWHIDIGTAEEWIEKQTDNDTCQFDKLLVFIEINQMIFISFLLLRYSSKSIRYNSILYFNHLKGLVRGLAKAIRAQIWGQNAQIIYGIFICTNGINVNIVTNH